MSLLASLGLDGDKQNTLDRLQDFIEWSALDHSWESVAESYSTDEVGCVLRNWEPQKNQLATYGLDGLKCLKASPPPCAVQQFIDSYRSELEPFASAAANHQRSNIASAAKAFISILSSDDVPFGERSNCYRISNTLIALEAPADAVNYSSDSDMGIICEILGRALHVETSVPQ